MGPGTTSTSRISGECLICSRERSRRQPRLHNERGSRRAWKEYRCLPKRIRQRANSLFVLGKPTARRNRLFPGTGKHYELGTAYRNRRPVPPPSVPQQKALPDEHGNRSQERRQSNLDLRQPTPANFSAADIPYGVALRAPTTAKPSHRASKLPSTYNVSGGSGTFIRESGYPCAPLFKV